MLHFEILKLKIKIYIKHNKCFYNYIFSSKVVKYIKLLILYKISNFQQNYFWSYN